MWAVWESLTDSWHYKEMTLQIARGLRGFKHNEDERSGWTFKCRLQISNQDELIVHVRHTMYHLLNTVHMYLDVNYKGEHIKLASAIL